MPLLTDSARGASLASCQANAFGPAPIALVVRLATDIAGALETASAGRRGVSPAQVRIGYDGAVDVVDPMGPEETAYLAPEQLSGAALDRRADVFSLAVVVWELLTGARLFARGSKALTTVAILDEPLLDARDVNPEIPPIIVEVLATALARDRSERFDTPSAFAKALTAARASAGLPDAGTQDLARWVAEHVPPRAQPASAVPELDIPMVPSSRRSAPASSASRVVAATSVRTAAAQAFSDASLSSAAPRSVAFDVAPDDDFDMEIERNLATSIVPAPTSSRPSGLHAGRPSVPSNAGLELGAPLRRSARTEPSERRAAVGLFAKLLGLVVALALFGGTAGALHHFVHRPGGRSLTALLPHAFDGLSATDSGAVAVVTLVVAAIVIFVGLRLRPHAWLVVLSGGALLLMALAMVTVTLASTGDNPTPPDGVLLVPFLAPASLLLLALGMTTRAGRMMARGGRVSAVPLAVLAGALAFVAFEVSRLAGR